MNGGQGRRRNVTEISPTASFGYGLGGKRCATQEYSGIKSSDKTLGLIIEGPMSCNKFRGRESLPDIKSRQIHYRNKYIVLSDINWPGWREIPRQICLDPFSFANRPFKWSSPKWNRSLSMYLINIFRNGFFNISYHREDKIYQLHWIRYSRVFPL
jgi:hypothetical protein